MCVEFRYNADVFPKRQMEQVKELFGAILGAVAGGADMSIGELKASVMSAEEKKEQDSFIKSALEISEDF
jgi:hypothetical protein